MFPFPYGPATKIDAVLTEDNKINATISNALTIIKVEDLLPEEVEVNLIPVPELYIGSSVFLILKKATTENNTILSFPEPFVTGLNESTPVLPDGNFGSFHLVWMGSTWNVVSQSFLASV